MRFVKYMKLVILLLLVLPAYVMRAATADSVCEAPLRYEVLDKNASVDDFLWIAGDKKYNTYYRGGDLLVEQRKKGILWLIHGSSFAPYTQTEMFIDTVYFQNISESPQKEMIVGYSLFSLKVGAHTKSKHMMIIDLSERRIVLNVATYDYKIGADENGKVVEYLYDADVEVSHNLIKVTSSDDSDIDNPAIQLDDGVYHRHGHCFVRH